MSAPWPRCQSCRPPVRDALDAGRPVVALESTIISHGLPRPGNLAAARSFEALLDRERGDPGHDRRHRRGAQGRARADADLERIATGRESVIKVSSRDLGLAMAAERTAGTTVAATSVLAARAGIRVFATGGLGGVHRGFAETMDESADLTVLSRTPVTVVSAGVKSILDIPATLERLETLGVAVAGYRTNRFPAFYLTDSGQDLDWRVDSRGGDRGGHGGQRRARRHVRAADGEPAAAGAGSSTRPCTTGRSTARCAAAESAGIRGKAVTPYLLAHMQRVTEGASVAVNLDVARGNIALAGQVATAWSARQRETR